MLKFIFLSMVWVLAITLPLTASLYGLKAGNAVIGGVYGGFTVLMITMFFITRWWEDV